MQGCFTVEENQEDARIGELLPTQQVHVLHAEVEGQFDDGPVLHVCGDVGHQSQVLHQTTGLRRHTTRIGQHIFKSPSKITFSFTFVAEERTSNLYFKDIINYRPCSQGQI